MLTFEINFMKMFIIGSLVYFNYIKVIGYKQITIKNTLINFISCITIAIIHAIILLLFEWNSITSMLLCSLILGFVTKLNIGCNKENYWVGYIFSFSLTYIIYLVAISISGILVYFLPNRDIFSPICVVLIAFISLGISWLVFRIPRFKNGINFIKNFNKKGNVILSIICVFIATLVLHDLFQKDFTKILLRSVPFIVFAIFNVLIYVVLKQITKHYKNNMRDRTIAVQKEEIDANEKTIEELKAQNLELAKTIHKYNHKLSSLENSIRKVAESSNVEFASELFIVLEQTRKVENQLADETKSDVKLPTTNVVSVDNMLDYMKTEAIKSGIDFVFKINDSIKPLLEKYITEDKFETLLGDHIKDAIIAINSKGDGYKSILVLVGIVDGAYELSIYDTGIEFDIFTLLKLGTEPITTHKGEGGSGLGFMTTFETMKSSGASLVIEEYDTSVTNYTKSVTIRFDGKCEYRIYSYRAKSIKEASSNRKIIIKSI